MKMSEIRDGVEFIIDELEYLIYELRTDEEKEKGEVYRSICIEAMENAKETLKIISK